MERFLQYSLQKERKIRMVMMLNGQMVQKTASVLALTDNDVTIRLTAKKTPLTLAADDILSCDYARGDHGED